MYLLDGYNLLFTLTESDHPLSDQRQRMVRFLQKRFAALKLEGIVVFDGKVRHHEESGRSYPSPLEIVYTQKGQSADAFIIEKLELSNKARQITVVTNDKGLIANVRSYGAKLLKNEEFIKKILIKKKNSTETKVDIADSKKNIERLQAIFEKKLKEEDH